MDTVTATLVGEPVVPKMGRLGASAPGGAARRIGLPGRID